MKVLINFNVMDEKMTTDQVTEFLEESACKITDHDGSEKMEIVDIRIHSIYE